MPRRRRRFLDMFKTNVGAEAIKEMSTMANSRSGIRCTRIRTASGKGNYWRFDR